MPSRRQGLRIEGLKELEQSLGELSKATARNVLKRTFDKAIEPVEQEAKQNAPRGEKEVLAESITFGTRLSPRQRSLHRRESPFEAFAGAGPLPQAHLQEFGPEHHDPQPFMGPAWEGNKTRVLGRFKQIMTAEIEKARQRAARKAARILSKIKRGTTR